MKSKLAISTIALTPAVVAPSVLLSQSNQTPTEFRKVEVHFYDKEVKTKKIRLYIDSLEGNKSFEFYDENETNEDKKGKDSGYIEEADKPLYQKLFSIGSKYIQTQDSLNLIKSNISNDNEDTFLNENKCCPKVQGATTCDCKNKDGCCSMRLACYADNSSETCCNSSTSYTGTNFKKTQKTFGYLRKNIYSGYSNIYLSPMQAHIKFTDDITFDNIKTNSTSTDTTSAKEFKNFVGSLVYGFVNYSYKSVECKQEILGNQDDYITLTNNSKDNYLYNIPQKFSFLYKEGTDAENHSDIEEVNKEVKNVFESIDKYKDSQKNATNCCNNKSDKTEVIKCLIGRNYMSLEKENNGLENIANKIKNAKEGCCS